MLIQEGGTAVITATGLANVFRVSDTDSLALSGAFGLYTLSLGSRKFIYAACLDDDGISSFELSGNGTLTPVQTIGDSTPLALGGAANFASLTVNGVTYLYVNGAGDSGISAFQVDPDGSLNSVQSVFDDNTRALEFRAGRISVVTSGGANYLIASGRNPGVSSGNGITVFRIGADGGQTATASVDDDGISNYQVQGARDSVTASIGGNNFVFVAGQTDNGITSFRVNADGSLTYADNVVDNGALMPA